MNLSQKHINKKRHGNEKKETLSKAVERGKKRKKLS